MNFSVSKVVIHSLILPFERKSNTYVRRQRMKTLRMGLMTAVSKVSVVTIEDNVRKKGNHEKRRKEMDRLVMGRMMMMDSRRMKNVVILLVAHIGKEKIVGSCMLVDSGTDSDNCYLDTD